jgi:hypothetical protein
MVTQVRTFAIGGLMETRLMMITNLEREIQTTRRHLNFQRFTALPVRMMA